MLQQPVRCFAVSVPVGYGRLAPAPEDFSVEVGEAADQGVGQPHAGLQVETVLHQVVLQGQQKGSWNASRIFAGLKEY